MKKKLSTLHPQPAAWKISWPKVRFGIEVDLLVVLCNLLIVPLFWRPVISPFVVYLSSGDAVYPLMALVVLISIGRLGGLYLKRFPVQARIGGGRDAAFPLYFFIFNFALMVLTAAGVVVTLQAATGVKESGGVMFAGVFGMFAACGLELYLIYRLSTPLNETEKTARAQGAWIYTRASERVANLGLFLYLMFYQAVYFLAADMFMRPPNGWNDFDIPMIVLTVIFLAIYFVLFYLAPRAIFLIDDRKYLGTWILIFLVFVTSMTRHLF